MATLTVLPPSSLLLLAVHICLPPRNGELRINRESDRGAPASATLLRFNVHEPIREDPV